MGCFINTLPLAANLDDGITFESVLDQVKEVMMEAYDNQVLPLEDIVHELGLKRDVSRNPLFQVGFVFQEPPMSFSLPGSDVSVMELENFGAMYDLHTFMWDDGDTIGGLLTYNSSLFSDEFVNRFIDTFETAVGSLLASPTEKIRNVEFLSNDDRKLLDDINATQMSFDKSASVVDLFKGRAGENPDRIAVSGIDGEYTYEELDTNSDAMAAYLSAKGVVPGDLVGISVDRGVKMLVSVLGIWKAGAAYVPLDPEYPNERLAYMMEASNLRLLVTQESLLQDLPEYDCTRVLIDTEWDDLASTAPDTSLNAAAGEDLAYVIFTSGSTGMPKGVQLPHRAVVNFLLTMSERPGLTANDKLLAVTTLSFDIAVLELYLPICAGAQTVIATADQAIDGHALVRIIADQQISVMQATPSTWRLMIANGWLESGDLSSFKILCGGEAFPPDLARALTESCDNVWNMYGPTETTVWSTCKKLEKGGNDVVIGKPIGNTGVHILNESGVRVPVGVPGSLHISGDGLAKGYLGRPDLTAENFFVHPTRPGVEVYATGDMVRLRENGDLDYMQRLDGQVKLRGYRIELGEIESVLADVKGVKEVVANIWKSDDGDRRLVAYVIPAVGRVNPIQLRKALRTRLPDYMIPQHYVGVEEFPMTANGKIDRQSLPSPLGVEREESREPPGTETEIKIASIWSEVLGGTEIFKEDHFFDIGGHSLLAVTVILLIHQAYGVRLNPRMIVMQSLSEIAKGLDETSGELRKAN